MDAPCSDQHINEISEKIVEWKVLAVHFGLSSAEVEQICKEHHQPAVQTHEMLRKWKHTLGMKATYSNLKENFLIAGNQALADEVDKLLRTPYSPSPRASVTQALPAPDSATNATTRRVFGFVSQRIQGVKRMFSSSSVNNKRIFTVGLYYCKESEKWVFTFVFSQGVDVLNQYATTNLKGTEEWAILNFHFKEECVTLDLEKEKIVNGWKLRNRQHPCQLPWRDAKKLGRSANNLPYHKMDAIRMKNTENELDFDVLLTGTVENDLSFKIYPSEGEGSVTHHPPALCSVTHHPPALCSVTHPSPTLCIGDLDDLMKALPHFTEWNKLGLSLGINARRLEEIEENKKRTNERLNEVLKDWLRQNYDIDKYGPPTWNRLVKVLEEDNIDRALANEIKKKYCERTIP